MLGVSGCASMSKEECRAVDWRTVGYEDGAAGRGSGAVSSRRKACAAAGVTLDLDAYQAGRAQGLREYCQPETGFRIGEQGGGYGGFCPPDLAPAFSQAYESGRELLAHEYRLRSTRSRIAATRHELEEIEHHLTHEGLAVVSDDTSSEARAQALVESTQLAERHERLKDELRHLEQDERRYARELEDFQAQLAARN
jgi:hypothetical protein